MCAVWQISGYIDVVLAKVASSSERMHERMATLKLLAVGLLPGAFVAGLDAGHAYNTFPLMGGHIVPEEYWALPGWRNTFENTAAVQFHHRYNLLCMLALLLPHF